MSAKALNLPNTLSLVRVFLAPIVLLFLSVRIGGTVPLPGFLMEDPPAWGDILAGAVFVVAALTDSFDGYIARRHRLVTTLRKFIDPLADKVLVIAAMTTCSPTNPFTPVTIIFSDICTPLVKSIY